MHYLNNLYNSGPAIKGLLDADCYKHYSDQVCCHPIAMSKVKAVPSEITQTHIFYIVDALNSIQNPNLENLVTAIVGIVAYLDIRSGCRPYRADRWY